MPISLRASRRTGRRMPGRNTRFLRARKSSRLCTAMRQEIVKAVERARGPNIGARRWATTRLYGGGYLASNWSASASAKRARWQRRETDRTGAPTAPRDELQPGGGRQRRTPPRAPRTAPPAAALAPQPTPPPPPAAWRRPGPGPRARARRYREDRPRAGRGSRRRRQGRDRSAPRG